jgi:hypothetical protein
MRSQSFTLIREGSCNAIADGLDTEIILRTASKTALLNKKAAPEYQNCSEKYCIHRLCGFVSDLVVIAPC